MRGGCGMNNFAIERTGIEGLLIVRAKRFGDDRGFFMETYNERSFTELGLDVKFVQDNRSRSARGTLRGLHFQKTHPQGKLVSVLAGSVFDVAVDLRRSSETFGRWFGVALTDDGTMFYVPPGFAHGFYVTSDLADFAYKCTDFYMPEDEGGLMWNDPAVGIAWPVADESALKLSDKDRANPSFEETYKFA
jgi:dTDP-4-dehydrorhamnose 3,5-epimerase